MNSSTRAIIFLVALPFTSTHTQAKHNLSLTTEIAVNMMQYVEWRNDENKTRGSTLCVLGNEKTTNDELNIGKLRVISINDHFEVAKKCDGLLVEKEFNYLIPAITLINNKRNTLIIGTSNNSLSNGAHFSLIREGSTYKIHGNIQKINSSKIYVSSKLMRLVKTD